MLCSPYFRIPALLAGWCACCSSLERQTGLYSCLLWPGQHGHSCKCGQHPFYRVKSYPCEISGIFAANADGARVYSQKFFIVIWDRQADISGNAKKPLSLHWLAPAGLFSTASNILFLLCPRPSNLGIRMMTICPLWWPARIAKGRFNSGCTTGLTTTHTTLVFFLLQNLSILLSFLATGWCTSKAECFPPLLALHKGMVVGTAGSTVMGWGIWEQSPAHLLFLRLELSH